MNNVKKSIENFVNDKNFNRELGQNWYKLANEDLRVILNELELYKKLNILDISLVCSILSPANKWETNLSDVRNILNWFFYGRLIGSELPKFFTYGQNVKKALNFLNERSSYRLKNPHLDSYQVSRQFTGSWGEQNMKALKTFNFWKNLSNPFYNKPEFFTIDRHMLKIGCIEKNQITPKQYKELQAIFFQVWKEQKFTCLFHEFQAILWANYVFLKRGIIHY